MVDPAGAGGGGDEDGAELLLPEAGDRERPWRLNFDGFRRAGLPEEKHSRGLQDCLGVLGGGDVVAEYYQQQVEMLEGFNEMDTLADRGFLPVMSKEEREKIARSEKMAIHISNVANMVLFAAKVYASIRSGSLAIIASTLDSLLDLLSGFILWFASFSMQTPNPYQYPIGKRRMQPLGILVFASVMATLGLQIILESMRSLVSNEDDFSLTKEQERWVVDIMLSVTLVKLVLVIYCRSFTNDIVKAYAQDHLFDVITNIIGLVAALLANYTKHWIDPVGAIIELGSLEAGLQTLGSLEAAAFLYFSSAAAKLILGVSARPSRWFISFLLHLPIRWCTICQCWGRSIRRNFFCEDRSWLQGPEYPTATA